MSGFFNFDNPVFVFLGKLCDVIFLSLIWLIVCIPIFTIGPANTALYYAVVKVIRRERGYITREFFKSFRLNFLRAAIVGIVLTIIFVILILDILTARSSLTSNASMNSVLFGVYVALFIFVLGISLYVFPFLSRFNMTVKQLIKAASFLSVRHLLHTIAMIIVFAVAAAAVFVLPLLLVIVPAAATLLNSFIMERILKKYTPDAENGENSSKDEWYLE
jgi:uncharacterized membrane protein YesL